MTQETRERLVRRGVELLTEFSLGATGLDGLLKSIGVTKGSFYHFFGSKQAFALEVVDWYGAYFEKRFTRILGDATVPPLERLRLWMDSSRRGMARHGYRRGCLVGNLSQELGPHDEVLAARLREVFQRWEAWVQGVLDEAQAAGDMPAGEDTRQLSRLFWIGWQGAILRTKLERSGRPLDEFAAFFLGTVARPQPPNRRRH